MSDTRSTTEGMSSIRQSIADLSEMMNQFLKNQEEMRTQRAHMAEILEQMQGSVDELLPASARGGKQTVLEPDNPPLIATPPGFVSHGFPDQPLQIHESELIVAASCEEVEKSDLVEDEYPKNDHASLEVNTIIDKSDVVDSAQTQVTFNHLSSEVSLDFVWNKSEVVEWKGTLGFAKSICVPNCNLSICSHGVCQNVYNKSPAYSVVLQQLNDIQDILRLLNDVPFILTWLDKPGRPPDITRYLNLYQMSTTIFEDDVFLSFVNEDLEYLLLPSSYCIGSSLLSNTSPLIMQVSAKQDTTEFWIDFPIGGISVVVSKIDAASVECVKLLIQNQDESINAGYLTGPYDGNVKLDYPHIGIQFKSEEILAQVLSKLVKNVFKVFNDKVDKGLVIAPTYFRESQRTAAKKKNNETIGDLGGGTYYVSVFEVGKKTFEVLSTFGVRQWGCDNFDRRIIDWFAKNFKQKCFTEVAEIVTMTLSSLSQVTWLTFQLPPPKPPDEFLSQPQVFDVLAGKLLDSSILRCFKGSPAMDELKKITFKVIYEGRLDGGLSELKYLIIQKQSEFVGAYNHKSMINLGSFDSGKRLDSGQKYDLYLITGVSSLCGDWHLGKFEAILDTVILVYKDARPLIMLGVRDLWNRMTLKENNHESGNDIDMLRMLSIHIPAYLDLVIKGLSIEMISYSNWHVKKMIPDQNLINSVLKNKFKFQGFIISDREGLDRITPPTHKNYTYSVLIEAQARSDMMLSPSLHFKTNESEDEKNKQEELKTKLESLCKGIRDVLGPTEVSESELNKALTDQLFEDENLLIWIDTHNCREHHHMRRLISDPAAYVGDEGGQFTEVRRRQLYYIIALEVVEKGHQPDYMFSGFSSELLSPPDDRYICFVPLSHDMLRVAQLQMKDASSRLVERIVALDLRVRTLQFKMSLWNESYKELQAYHEVNVEAKEVHIMSSAGYINYIFMFSLPRPPEIASFWLPLSFWFSSPRPPEVADLEDKVNFKDGGMLQNRILRNLGELLAFWYNLDMYKTKL